MLNSEGLSSIPPLLGLLLALLILVTLIAILLALALFLDVNHCRQVNSRVSIVSISLLALSLIMDLAHARSDKYVAFK